MLKVLFIFLISSPLFCLAQQRYAPTKIINNINDVVIWDSLTYRLQANGTGTIFYQVAEFSGLHEQIYASLQIVEGDKVVFEWLEKKEELKVNFTKIDERRAEWIKYCNLHNARNLVENLYSEKAIYFNHKPLIVGREAIIEDYRYMNNPTYNLHLAPLHLHVISDQIIFEIGQCSGSYNGKYVLVWEKEADGQWWIAMDSNI